MLEPGTPAIGVLHCDRDGSSDSVYCAVPGGDFARSGIGTWILGHIHKPDSADSVRQEPRHFYPGSPQPLHPGEPGPHGPWLIEFEGLHSVVCRQVPMSLVRYDEYDVDLKEADTSDAFESHVNDTVSMALENVTDDDDPPQLLSLRLDFVGATPLCGRIDSLARQLDDLERSRGGVRARIDKYTNRTRPDLNLDELAQRNDPAGVLARTLIALEQSEEDESLAALMRDATARLQEVHCASAYVGLVDRDLTPDRETSRQVLLLQGRQLLEALQAQMPQRQESPA
jgi:DNA repair exonuclease SbcCD nuclease subunit